MGICIYVPRPSGIDGRSDFLLLSHGKGHHVL